MTAMQIFSLAERPDLAERLWDVGSDWPTFMLQDPVSATRYEPAIKLFPDLHLLALEDDHVIARVHAVPIRWPGADELPDRGWDWALESAVDHPTDDRSAVSLIEARVAPSERGRGLSAQLLTAARDAFRRLGTTDLVGPVRPNGKALESRTPPHEYATRTRSDGLPADSWLRVHVRLGGRIVKVAPLSMTIPGTLTQWREWTGLPLDCDGLVEVPGALAPVFVDTTQGHAVYIEPNVWVHHAL